MCNLVPINDVELHFKHAISLSGESFGTIRELQYQIESFFIRSSCRTGAFKVCAEYQYRPYDEEAFSLSYVICPFRVC